MKIRKAQPQRQTLKRNVLYTVLAIAALSYSQGCEEVVRYGFENGEYTPDDVIPQNQLPDASKYELDIAMITPFTGRINPVKKHQYLYISDNKIYSSDALTCDNNKCADLDKKNIILNGKMLTLNPSPNQTLDCVVYDNYDEIADNIKNNFTNLSETPTDEPSADETPRDIKYAHCTYHLGGAIGLYNTWEKLKNKNVRQIKLSSGDSFGTSANVSAQLADIPTPIVMNAIGLDIDTFGNHNFDQNLSYLQNVLKWADYKYVATNLTNIPQNLPGVVPTVLVEVPPSDSDSSSNNLKVAIVSALDMQAMSTVYPGRFGSLGIDNYCALIQTIEDAYNEGARGFFILGHLIANNDSLKAVLNAISYFNDHDAYKGLFSYKDIAEHYSNLEKQKAYNGDLCPSVLEVPKKLLLDKFKTLDTDTDVTHVDDIDFTKDEHKIAYQEIIQEMHREIYNGIIGILGEGSSKSLAVTIEPTSEQPSNVVQCQQQSSTDTPQSAVYTASGCKTNDNYTFYNHLENYNLFGNSNTSEITASQNISCIANDTNNKYMNFFDSIGLSCRSLSDFPNKTHHSILYTQFPSEGVNTAQLSIVFEPSKTPDNDNTYVATIQKLDYQPVAENISNAENNFEQQNYHSCKTMFETMNKSITTEKIPTDDGKSEITINELYNACNDYFIWRKTEKTVIQSIDKLDETNREQLENCFKFIKSYISESSDPLTSKLQTSVNALNCMHLSTAQYICPDNNFKAPSYYDFSKGELWNKFNMDNVNIIADADERRKSIFKTNLFIESMFRYLKANQNSALDFAISNAGDLKRVTDLQEITYSKLVELAPYDSTIQMVELKANQLIEIINTILPQCDGDFGGYPIFSGLVISTVQETIEGKGVQQLNEIWKVDNKGALLEPIYVNLSDMNGVFASYKLNENNRDELLVDFHPNSPFYYVTNHKEEADEDKYIYSPCRPLEQNIPFAGAFDDTNDKETWIISKTSPYKVLSSSYLVGGGDGYIFPNATTNYYQDNPKYSTKEYIIAYLSTNSDSDVSSIGDITKDQVCKSTSDTDDTPDNTSVSQTTYDGIDTDTALCQFLLNKHFYISESSNKTSFSRYISSKSDEHDSSTEPFDDECNKWLYGNEN